MSIDISPAIVTPAKATSMSSSGTDSTSFAEKADQPEAFVAVLNDKLSETSQSVTEKDTDPDTTELSLMTEIHADIPDSGDSEASSLLMLKADADVGVDATVNGAADKISNNPITQDEVQLQALLAMLPHQIANTLEQKSSRSKAEPDTAIKKPDKSNAALSGQIQQQNKLPAVTKVQPVWINPAENHPLSADTAELTRSSENHSHTGQEKTPFQQATNSLALLPGNGNSSESPLSRTTMITAELPAQLGSKEWQQTLGQQILLFTRNGQQNAQLRLHPQDLGTVHVRLSLDDNMAQLHFASAQVQVRAALEAAMPGLRNALAEGGIQLGQSTVSSDTASQWQQAGQDSDQLENNDHTKIVTNSTEQKLLVTPVTLESLAAGGRAIDVFA